MTETVAIIGFTDDPALPDAIKEAFQANSVQAFATVRDAASHVVRKVTTDAGAQKLDGSGVLFLISPARERDFARAQNLIQVGAEVQQFSSDFEPGRSEEDIAHWASNSGEWPKGVDDLLDDFFGDDEEELPAKKPAPAQDIDDLLDRPLVEDTRTGSRPVHRSDPFDDEDDEDDYRAPRRDPFDDEDDEPARPSQNRAPRRDPFDDEDDYRQPRRRDDDPRRASQKPQEIAEDDEVRSERVRTRSAFQERPGHAERPSRNRESQSRESQSREREDRDAPRDPYRSTERDRRRRQSREDDWIQEESRPRRRSEWDGLDDRPSYEEEDDTDGFIQRPSGRTFRDDLNEGDRREQEYSKELVTSSGRRAASGASFTRRAGRGSCYFITGANGGVGKTTLTWHSANLHAKLLKDGEQEDNKARPRVWLVETDYSNPKLANRIESRISHNSGIVAEAMRYIQSTINSDRVEGDADSLEVMTEAIERSYLLIEQTGLLVVPAPYDTTTRDPRLLRQAISNIIRYALRNGDIVYVDAPTVSSSDDTVNSQLIENFADHVVVVGNPGDNLDDVVRATRSITKPKSQGGIGADKRKVSIFMNMTSQREHDAIERDGDLYPHPISGYLDYLPQWNNVWAGRHNEEVSQEVWIESRNRVAYFMANLDSFRELDAFLQTAPKKLASKKRSGGIWALFSAFGRRND